jgi:hypothetical protein
MVDIKPYRGYQITDQPVLGNEYADSHLFKSGHKNGSVVNAVADQEGLRAYFTISLAA